MFIGYGQSGSGKTSTLINFVKKNGKVEEGVLSKFLKNYENNLESIDVECVNLYYQENEENKINNYGEFNIKKNYKTEIYNFNSSSNFYDKGQTNMVLSSETDFRETNEYSVKNIVLDSDDSINEVCKLILKLFDARQIRPTPNNEISSRSHIMVCLTLNFKKEDINPRKLIICDLAGVENEFQCELFYEIKKFDNQYELLRAKAAKAAAAKEDNNSALIAFKQLWDIQDIQSTPEQKDLQSITEQKDLHKPFNLYYDRHGKSILASNDDENNFIDKVNMVYNDHINGVLTRFNKNTIEINIDNIIQIYMIYNILYVNFNANEVYRIYKGMLLGRDEILKAREKIKDTNKMITKIDKYTEIFKHVLPIIKKYKKGFINNKKDIQLYTNLGIKSSNKGGNNNSKGKNTPQKQDSQSNLNTPPPTKKQLIIDFLNEFKVGNKEERPLAAQIKKHTFPPMSSIREKNTDSYPNSDSNSNNLWNEWKKILRKN